MFAGGSAGETYSIVAVATAALVRRAFWRAEAAALTRAAAPEIKEVVAVAVAVVVAFAHWALECVLASGDCCSAAGCCALPEGLFRG